MSNGFPPTPAFPYGIDDDRSLFLVYNTAEAPLTANNSAWADEVSVRPRKSGQTEVWADNGFATISGEMFYYDAVEKNGDGYVTKLKRCVRNLGGQHTRFNEAGTMVRGFVVAEHHNQLVDALTLVEGFVGENFSPEEATLDWRIRNLRAADPIFDDFDCPDVTFSFVVLEDNPATGILAAYSIEVVGRYTDFTLNFGDGNFTKSVGSGTHQYAPNAIVDPVITITNDKCQVVQSPIERERTDTPAEPQTIQTIDLPVPVCPEIGDISTPTPDVPPPEVVIPPIVLPCVEAAQFPSIGSVNIPSVIIFSDISIPSVIDFGPVNIPSMIEVVGIGTIPSVIEFGPVSFPSVIEFGPPPTIGPIEFGPPPTIGPIEFGPPPQLGPIPIDPLVIDVSITPVNVDVNVNISPVNINISPVGVNIETQVSVIFEEPPCIPVCWGDPPPVGPVLFGPAPVLGPVGFDEPPAFPCIEFCDPPCVPICWGEAPTVPVNITVTCNCQCCPSSAAMNVTEPEFVDSFNPFAPTDRSWADAGQMELNYDFQGFPSVIEIMPPEIPAVQIVHDLPTRITLDMPSQTVIEYVGPPIPSLIEIKVPDKPIEVALKAPEKLVVDASGIPASIQLEAPASLPPVDVTVNVTGIPTHIQVVGMPSVVELVHSLPETIQLVMPENPTVQMLAPATPISVQITMDLIQEQVAQEVRRQMAQIPIVPGA
jgi:hypothetical protein